MMGDDGDCDSILSAVPFARSREKLSKSKFIFAFLRPCVLRTSSIMKDIYAMEEECQQQVL